MERMEDRASFLLLKRRRKKWNSVRDICLAQVFAFNWTRNGGRGFLEVE